MRKREERTGSRDVTGVNKRELMEEEREVMPQQGEEPGGERKRERVGKGRRRMRGLHSRI